MIKMKKVVEKKPWKLGNWIKPIYILYLSSFVYFDLLNKIVIFVIPLNIIYTLKGKELYFNIICLISVARYLIKKQIG